MDKLCDLKIISENGKFTIILKMLNNSKIADVYSIIHDFSET